jgi:transketolase
MNILPEFPDWKDRDRFILGKGHACAAVYAVLAERDYFSKKWLDNFYHKDSLLSGHISHHVPGVEASTGSLGHGLSIGCGMAMATRKKVYVLIGDGDCNEGSTWEAALFAGHHFLNNLVVIVDYNHLQALGETDRILTLVPLKEKWQSFGWRVENVNGHNTSDLDHILRCDTKGDEPTCIIAFTEKGHGVSFMEDDVEWHYKSPNDEELALALKELGQ